MQGASSLEILMPFRFCGELEHCCFQITICEEPTMCFSVSGTHTMNWTQTDALQTDERLCFAQDERTRMRSERADERYVSQLSRITEARSEQDEPKHSAQAQGIVHLHSRK
jgi:hypothetical protein